MTLGGWGMTLSGWGMTLGGWGMTLDVGISFRKFPFLSFRVVIRVVGGPLVGGALNLVMLSLLRRSMGCRMSVRCTAPCL